MTFIDDYSHCVMVFFMKNKSEVLEKFKQFEAIATSESGNQIGIFQSDNGGEYCSNEFEQYLKEKGIRHSSPTDGFRLDKRNCVRDNMNVQKNMND